MYARGLSLSAYSSLDDKIKRLVLGTYYDRPYLFPRVARHETYLISFPRSGNTWLRRLLTALIHQKRGGWRLTESTVPDVHKYKLEKKRKPSIKPLIVKSHTPFVDIPAKVIYVVRDGRDALLSYYYLQLKEGKIKSDIPPIDIYFDNHVWPCQWHVHVAGWLDGLAKRSPESYKITYYEDLKKSTAEQLLLIAEFIGLSVTPDDVERAISLHPVEHYPKLEAGSTTSKLKWQDILVGENLVKYEAIAGVELQRLGYPLMSSQ
ncbi:sulfotransferase domain-containing protein [Gloeocapsopsis crepidinum LEGE 06123]|uniref:Sulfotransferase domain-containing protein n=1 Tax=Gloeocapsopsis crepidinum LEGE 06123 TaxID=588587 RepID=A0ABR9US07_9CHRO|nr:sulfotransferase domain-containing protein [Gloeocapsopsis crepidinum]MBE9191039.1 sulfotransferase domain-containing protein [Gloeocapsopsis crepidinum LEGE 06123]